jgi:putative SOS response-associated peptidase YedK
MPVMLSKDVEHEWLNPDLEPEQALDLLAQDIPAKTMEAYPVSMKGEPADVRHTGFVAAGISSICFGSVLLQ